MNLRSRPGTPQRKNPHDTPVNTGTRRKLHTTTTTTKTIDTVTYGHYVSELCMAVALAKAAIYNYTPFGLDAEN